MANVGAGEVPQPAFPAQDQNAALQELLGRMIQQQPPQPQAPPPGMQVTR